MAAKNNLKNHLFGARSKIGKWLLMAEPNLKQVFKLQENKLSHLLLANQLLALLPRVKDSPEKTKDHHHSSHLSNNGQRHL